MDKELKDAIVYVQISIAKTDLKQYYIERSLKRQHREVWKYLVKSTGNKIKFLKSLK